MQGVNLGYYSIPESLIPPVLKEKTEIGYFYIMVYDKYGRKSDSACRVHSGQIALINENLKYLD